MFWGFDLRMFCVLCAVCVSFRLLSIFCYPDTCVLFLVYCSGFCLMYKDKILLYIFHVLKLVTCSALL